MSPNARHRGGEVQSAAQWFARIQEQGIVALEHVAVCSRPQVEDTCRSPRAVKDELSAGCGGEISSQVKEVSVAGGEAIYEGNNNQTFQETDSQLTHQTSSTFSSGHSFARWRSTLHARHRGSEGQRVAVWPWRLLRSAGPQVGAYSRRAFKVQTEQREWADRAQWVCEAEAVVHEAWEEVEETRRVGGGTKEEGGESRKNECRARTE
ncbi:hypothetical protein C8R44DRAFT_747050 [Mycena epipterygia]|nr:hypothetical protein C8R44DRAFT_747050 [Mycena epipterygia]